MAGGSPRVRAGCGRAASRARGAWPSPWPASDPWLAPLYCPKSCLVRDYVAPSGNGRHRWPTRPDSPTDSAVSWRQGRYFATLECVPAHHPWPNWTLDHPSLGVHHEPPQCPGPVLPPPRSSPTSTPPPSTPTPRNTGNLGGTIYYAADDGERGAELWKSDGTADGTVLVQDIFPGAGSSSPSGMTLVHPAREQHRGLRYPRHGGVQRQAVLPRRGRGPRPRAVGDRRDHSGYHRKAVSRSNRSRVRGSVGAISNRRWRDIRHHTDRYRHLTPADVVPNQTLTCGTPFAPSPDESSPAPWHLNR